MHRHHRLRERALHRSLTNWPRARQGTATIAVTFCWPPTLLALGYSTYTLGTELASRCGSASTHLNLWWTIGFLSGVLFGLTTVRIIAGKSPWLFIEIIGNVFLISAFLWVLASGGLLFLLAGATPLPSLGPHGRALLASPGLIPLVQTLGAITALRLTEEWTAKKRTLLLAALTLGIPTLWITAVEILATLIC